MTAPLVAELRRRRPDLRLTIQTSLPRDFLATRYGTFEHVPQIPDFGFQMLSPTAIDIEASAARYVAQHAGFPALVETEAARLRAAAPNLVLANVPYVTVAAAARAGIPVAAYSSLNWADLADHYLSDLPHCDGVRAQMRAAYAEAEVFLRPTPAQPMTLPNVRDIGTVAQLGCDRRQEVRRRLGVGEGTRLGVIAYGGIDFRLSLAGWPHVDGWFWLSSLLETPERPDMAPWQAAGVPFADLLPSIDLIVGKTGYGTFTEAALAGIPVLYEPRPDWPEGPPLEEWLHRHTRCLPAAPGQLLDGKLEELLHTLFSLPEQPFALPTGVPEGVDILMRMVDLRTSSAVAVDVQGDHDAEASNGDRK